MNNCTLSVLHLVGDRDGGRLTPKIRLEVRLTELQFLREDPKIQMAIISIIKPPPPAQKKVTDRTLE